MPQWVAFFSSVVLTVLMVPVAFKVYVAGDYTDTATMRLLGVMLSPMLPYIGLAVWRGLDMPEVRPPVFEDTSRHLTVGDQPPPPKERLTLEGRGLIAAGACGFGGMLAGYLLQLLWPFLLGLAGALVGLAVASIGHVRRINRPDDG